MENKVISFPEKKMKRVKKFQQAEAKTAMVSLSVVTLIMGAMILNENFSRSVRPVYLISDRPSQIETLNRAIASAQPMNPFRDLEWEKSLAKKLGQIPPAGEQRIPSSVGRGVTSIEQLRFGVLAGKYQLLNQAIGETEKIRAIEYVDSQEASDQPVILEPDDFMQKYGNLLSVKYEFAEKTNPNQTNVREYRLLSGDRKVIGVATFVIDDLGRFISLKVQDSQGESSF